MKKKLLIIGLVLCCVWGAMAAENKLLNAIGNGDLNTIKTQIELLDVDVNEKVDGSYLLDYAVGSWCNLAKKNCDIWNGFNTVHQNYFNKDFYEQSDKYKVVIEYLVSKGAELSDGCIQNWITRNDASYNITIMEYLLKKKILNLNRVINYNDGYKRRNDSVGNLYYSICVAKAVLDTQWQKSGWREKFILISHYFPIPSDYEGYYTIESSLVTILRNDLQGIKELIKKGIDIDSESQLFINSKAIADLLKATDNYKLANFSGYITPYYVGTIIPKYCTQCLTQYELALMKLITDYNSSMNRADALAKVKVCIANGVDVNKQQQVLGGAPIVALPKMVGKDGDDDILDEVLHGTKEEQAQRAKEAQLEKERLKKEELEKKKLSFPVKYIREFSSNIRKATSGRGKKVYRKFLKENMRYNVEIRRSSSKTFIICCLHYIGYV